MSIFRYFLLQRIKVCMQFMQLNFMLLREIQVMNLSSSSRVEKLEFTLWPLASFLHQNCASRRPSWHHQQHSGLVVQKISYKPFNFKITLKKGYFEEYEAVSK